MSEATGHTQGLRWQLEAVVDGKRVRAAFDRTHLVCDEALLGRAEIMVRLGEPMMTSAGVLIPTLTGDPVLVAITLMRASDGVLAGNFAFDLGEDEPGLASSRSLERQPQREQSRTENDDAGGDADVSGTRHEAPTRSRSLRGWATATRP